jgi:hypothetical protein
MLLYAYTHMIGYNQHLSRPTQFAYAELEDTTMSDVRRYGRTYEEVWRCAADFLYRA